MKTAILWDLDGTLLDTLDDLLDATNHALYQFGQPPRTRAELRRFVGNGAENQIRLALGDHARDLLQPVLKTYKAYYTEHCRIKTQPYAGVTEALAKLGEKYPMAIVSNKPDAAVKALCADFFPGIAAMGESPDCPRKPAPDMVFRAMELLGAERCVYVGDSEVDVLTAANAGVPCVSVLWGFRDREDLEKAGGRYYCADPGNLTEMIEEIINGK